VEDTMEMVIMVVDIVVDLKIEALDLEVKCE
jgi:hypothetical protein